MSDIEIDSWTSPASALGTITTGDQWPATQEWQPMEAAPKNATWVILKLPKDRGYPNWRCVVAHWAHGGGDDQPFFGPAWFEDSGYQFTEIKPSPIAWMPLPARAYASLTTPPSTKP